MTATTVQARTPRLISETTPKVVVLVPAYNEETGIAATLEGLLAQDIPLHRLVVIVNTTGPVLEDSTAAIARTFPGVIVEELTDNQYKKAGAMNYGWLKHGHDADYIFTMDADTVVFPDTIRMMLQEFRGHDRTGAVCARYWAQAGSGPAWRLQRIEYARYDDARDLRSWRVQVASGAAAMYRSRAISEVLEATGRTAPWDGESLIEDYALSLDIRALNWYTRAAAGAHVLTDTPQTFKELWNQRLRWGRGGVDEVRKRGWKQYMLMDIAGYGLYALGMLSRLLFLTYLAIIIFTGMGYSWSWLGLIPFGIIAAARITSFLRLNGRQAVDYAIVVPILVEDFYGFFLEWCAAVSIYKSFRSARQSW